MLTDANLRPQPFVLLPASWLSVFACKYPISAVMQRTKYYLDVPRLSDVVRHVRACSFSDLWAV